MKDQPKSRRNNSRTLIFILVAAVVATVISLFAGKIYRFTTDAVTNLLYSAPAEIDQIATDIGLTDSGKFIFGGSQPSIESREDFNRHCESYDSEVSTLGCYHNGKIYIYDVQAADLAGIKESTAAHELMHAVWARLSSFERAKLEESILEVYNSEQHNAEFSKQLETYDEDEMVEELHSRFATEVKNLPETLEKHYAKYFKDQDKLVEFYERYRAPFEKLDAEFTELSNELKTLQNELDELQATYESDSKALEQKIAEFNQCADTAGCFTSDYAFNSRRNELVEAQAKLEDLYEELSQKVNDYNAKVDEYNNSILRGEELDSKMNSNSKVKGEL